MGRKPTNNPSTSSVKKPSFFKIMMGDFTKTLHIPFKFTKRLEANLHITSILKDPLGRCWPVEVNNTKDGLFLENGWPRFVENNFIEYGELLIFTYFRDSNSQFNVKIYDKTGCEKNIIANKWYLKQNSESQENARISRRESVADGAGVVHGRKQQTAHKTDFSSQNGDGHLTPIKRKANRQRISGRKSRDEMPTLTDSEELILEEGCQIHQNGETREDSVDISGDFQCKPTAAFQKEILDEPQDQLTTKRRGRKKCLVRSFVESSTNKRTKSDNGSGSIFEEQRKHATHLEKSSPVPGQVSSKTSKGHMEHREKGFIKGKLINSAATMGSDHLNSGSEDMMRNSETEVISVHSESESSSSDSEDMINYLNMPVPIGKDTVAHRNARELTYSTDEDVESHEVGRSRNEEFPVSEDNLASPIHKESLNLPNTERSAKRRLCVTSQNMERRAVERGTELNSENPSCRVLLCRAYICKGFMNLSFNFIRRVTNISIGRDAGKKLLNIRLWVSDGRMWNVRLTCLEYKAYLCHGWSTFVVENNLREGDICLFELMKTGEVVDLKVSIYPKSKIMPATNWSQSC